MCHNNGVGKSDVDLAVWAHECEFLWKLNGNILNRFITSV